MQKIVAQLFRFLVGGLFIFSGFVKAVDPIGTSIKLDKYFVAWSETINELFLHLTAISLPLAYFVVSAEVVLGIFLVLNYKKEVTIKALLVVISFFTVLTCYTAITGEPTDCGCFGDFMVISPWSSFTKDIVLLGMILFIMKYKEHVEPEFKGVKASLAMCLVTLIVFGFSYFNLMHLPVIDFRPYKIGSDITELVLGTPAVFKYQLMFKEDTTKTILVDKLEKGIFEKYKWKEQVEVVPAIPPKILEFRIDNEKGDNITKQVMKGKTAFLVIRKLKYLNNETGSQLKAIEDELVKEGYEVYIMSGVTKSTFMGQSSYKQFNSPFSTIDEDISKAMIRANLGLVLFEDGIVAAKWALSDVPINEIAIKSN